MVYVYIVPKFLVGRSSQVLDTTLGRQVPLDYVKYLWGHGGRGTVPQYPSVTETNNNRSFVGAGSQVSKVGPLWYSPFTTVPRKILLSLHWVTVGYRRRYPTP